MNRTQILFIACSQKDLFWLQMIANDEIRVRPVGVYQKGVLFCMPLIKRSLSIDMKWHSD